MEKPTTQSEVEPGDAHYWLTEIAAAKSRLDGWYMAAEKAEERYEDCDGEDQAFGRLNILWANVETQKAAIGEDFGQPEVTRVNMPTHDGGLARHIAMVWERVIVAAVKEDDDNHDLALATGDVFLPGRGQVWLELEADDDKDDGSPGWVRAPLVRVPYREYLEGSATRWGSVPWVARLHKFTGDELISECKLSPAEAAAVPKNITLPHLPKGVEQSAESHRGKEQFKRAAVWEIWTKYPRKMRLYVAEDYKDRVLLEQPDPWNLKNFFPCPRPQIANGDEAKPPLTDYSRYRDQAAELDEICSRIFVLTAMLQRRGVHDKAFEELADLQSIEENTTIGVDNWVDMQAKGGLNKVMEWEDITPIALIIAELHKQRQSLMTLIYELSGISDLARGHTDPDETLGAQKLKQSFGSSRFRRREKESRRFAAEAYSLKGEVIAEHFPREQLEEMSGIKLPLQSDIDEARQALQQLQQQTAAARAAGQPAPEPDPVALMEVQEIANTRFSWERIKGVLRHEYRRCYSVEVETDQHQFKDEQADQQARTQFFSVVMQALEKVAPMIAGNPKTGEVFKAIVMFVVSSFKSGRSLEEGLERAIDEAVAKATEAAQQGPQPDPKAEADKMEAEARVQISQINLQIANVKLQMAQAEAGMAGQGVAEQAAKSQLKAQESQIKAAEGMQKVQTQEMLNQSKAAGHAIEMRNKAEQLEFERTQRATAREEILKDNHAAAGAANGQEGQG